jgi:hypothetical protein
VLINLDKNSANPLARLDAVTGAQIGNRNAYTGKGFDYLGFWSISTGISLPAAIARP